jgi:hypothetical protein
VICRFIERLEATRVLVSRLFGVCHGLIYSYIGIHVKASSYLSAPALSAENELCAPEHLQPTNRHGARFVNVAHTTGADRRKNFVWAEFIVGGKGICVIKASLADEGEPNF